MYGGGGIVPDFLVHEDTVSTLRQEFLRAIAPKGQQIQTVLQQYSGELRSRATPQFAVTPDVGAELRRRMRAAGVAVDARFDTAATNLLGEELDRRVARRAFGEAEAKKRSARSDRALTRAIDLLRQSRTQQDLLRVASAAASGQSGD